MSPLLVLTAVIPGLLICYVVFRLDKYEREPFLPMLYSFLLGTLITLPAVFIEMGAFSLDQHMDFLLWLKPFLLAYFIIGLGEELLKYLVLRFYAFPRPFFNEPLDGIVYAVLIAMGFATAENLMYAERFGMETVVLRVFTAVPAHLVFALVQGYYAGLAKFQTGEKRQKLLMKGLGIAVLLHGTYDFLLLQRWLDWLFVFATTAVYLSLYYTSNFIREHQENSPFK
jgi:RsiW-degrading membrane proteinase PrsW (M82 family)